MMVTHHEHLHEVSTKVPDARDVERRQDGEDLEEVNEPRHRASAARRVLGSRHVSLYFT